MTAMRDDQRDDVIRMIRAGRSNDEVAAELGVSPYSVRAIRSHVTMGTYDARELEEVIDAVEASFGLERDLQAALRANLEQLEPGLKAVDDGRELTTEAGRIDITAEDREGNRVVIELKAGEARPESVSQVLAYMGVLSEADSRPVRGILVAQSFHPRVVHAAKAVPNLILRRYIVHFRFQAP
jgi:RecB family endonuclease NucS